MVHPARRCLARFGRVSGLLLRASLCVAFALAACSDDGALAPADQGPPFDLPTSRTDRGPRSDTRLDGPPSVPDIFPPSVCDPACTAQDISQCVRSPLDGDCVECLMDGDCTGNPGALGSKCDTSQSFCVCDTDADCSRNRRGTTCDLANQMCVCGSNADCRPPFTLCLGTSVKTCRLPCRFDGDCTPAAPECDLPTGRCFACRSDQDCAANSVNRFCHSTSGTCVSCRTDADCKGETPFCDAAQGRCFECKTSAGCVASPDGTVCSQGDCVCASDADCGSTYPWGATCLTSLSTKRCGCKAEADCVGDPHGPTCYTPFQRCSCRTSADCSTSAYSICALPYEDAAYAHCQAPCVSDGECRDRTFGGTSAGFEKCTGGKCVVCSTDTDCAARVREKLCDAALGRCVVCRADGDCGGTTPLCDAGRGECIECRGAADCTASLNGPFCVDGGCRCVSDGDCASPGAWGRKCLTSSGRCGCDTDAQCSGVAAGPACQASRGKCTCRADGDCGLVPFTTCGLAYATAPYLFCQKPCAGDLECKSRMVAGENAGFTKCTGGRCVACTTDSDCSDASAKHCNAAIGRCVQCKTSVDCSGQEWAKTCDPTTGCVECMGGGDCTPAALGSTCEESTCVCVTNSDCAGNENGGRCDGTLRACTCTSNGDCIPPRTCTGAFLTAKVCE